MNKETCEKLANQLAVTSIKVKASKVASDDWSQKIKSAVGVLSKLPVAIREQLAGLSSDKKWAIAGALAGGAATGLTSLATGGNAISDTLLGTGLGALGGYGGKRLKDWVHNVDLPASIDPRKGGLSVEDWQQVQDKAQQPNIAGAAAKWGLGGMAGAMGINSLRNNAVTFNEAMRAARGGHKNFQIAKMPYNFQNKTWDTAKRLYGDARPLMKSWYDWTGGLGLQHAINKEMAGPTYISMPRRLGHLVQEMGTKGHRTAPINRFLDRFRSVPKGKPSMFPKAINYVEKTPELGRGFATLKSKVTPEMLSAAMKNRISGKWLALPAAAAALYGMAKQYND